MSDTIVVALISGGVTLAVCLVNNFTQSKKLSVEMDKQNEKQLENIKNELKTQNELQAYKIDELKTQVEKHNRVIERVYKLEQNEAVFEEKIDVVNHRIKDLEGYHK